MEVTGDLLSASGLLLATVSLLFSVWHPEITSATNVSTKGLHADRGPQRGQVKQALFFRALPLLLATMLIFSTCAPPAIAVIIHAATDARGGSYDAVRTMFVGVWVLTIGLGVMVTSEVWKLIAKRRTLNADDPPRQ